LVEKHEVKKLLEQITGIYLNVKLSKDTAGIWAECLRDIPYKQAKNNLIKHIKSSKFPPTIADILQLHRQPGKDGKEVDKCEVTCQEYELFDPEHHGFGRRRVH